MTTYHEGFKELIIIRFAEIKIMTAILAIDYLRNKEISNKRNTYLSVITQKEENFTVNPKALHYF